MFNGNHLSLQNSSVDDTLLQIYLLASLLACGTNIAYIAELHITESLTFCTFLFSPSRDLSATSVCGMQCSFVADCRMD
jgi:hypothetical protein